MKLRRPRLTRLIALLLSICMAVTLVPPTAASAAAVQSTLAVNDTVRFDFRQGASGPIAVPADHAYYTDGSSTVNVDETSGYVYGFIGIGRNGYKASDRTDGLEMLPGMEITLGSNANGVYAEQTIYAQSETDKNAAFDMGDATIPVRFAMQVERNSYYTVTAVLANASDAEDAVVSLYSERRHQIVTNETIAPGATKTVTFNVAVADVYFSKSEPNGTYQDDQLNVVVTGDNAALATLQVSRINPVPAIRVVSDSTGCDQYGYMPVYPLQNYTGVGQGLTAYFQNVPMSNHGEGGLASSDNAHLNSAKAVLTTGDYLYVEYGHNEKDLATFAGNLAKYYEAANNSGANLLLVGPIDRSQDSRYQNGAWTSSLDIYSKVAENYVTCLICGGPTAAAEYASKVGTTDENGSDAAEAYVETLTNAGITADGVKNAAFIDLNAGWVSFLNSVAGSDPDRANFYYTHNKRGNKDATHINDYGANQAAYIFAQQVKEAYEAGQNADEGSNAKIQANVLATLYNDYTANRSDVQPDTVPEEVIAAGQPASNSHYPQRFVEEEKPPYPVIIDEIQMTDGKLTTAKVSIVDELTAYAKVGVKYGSTTVWTIDHLDNTSNHKGSSAVLSFASDRVIPDGTACEALVYPVSMDANAEYDGTSAAISGPYSFAVKNGRVYKNLSLNKTPIADTNYAGYPVTNATDGNKSTGYVPNSGKGTDPGVVTVDLGAPAQIASIDLYSLYDNFTYKIETSTDGSAFTVPGTNGEGSNGADNLKEATIDFDTPVKAQYVRVTMDRPSSNTKGWTGMGFDVYGYTGEEPVEVKPETSEVPEIVNLSLNKTVTGQHGSNSKNPYKNAVDGNHTTCAGPSSAAGSTWFQVDLESFATIDHIDLYGWGTYNYTIEVSNDNTIFTEAAKSPEAVTTPDSQDSSKYGTTVTFEGAVEARYVKVTVDRGSGTYPGIGFDVYGYISSSAPPIECVTITGDSTVEVGKTLQLTATVAPAGAESGVAWTSSDTTKATVDSTGKVTGIAAGEVTITATSTADTAKTATHTVTVSEASGVALENLSLNKTVTGQHASNSRNPYKNAVDGDHSTCAGPSSKATETWFQVDLEKTAQIDRIDLYCWGNFNYTIEVSTDGEQYTEAAKSTQAVTTPDMKHSTNKGTTVTFDTPLDARYVKVTVARPDNQYQGIGFDVYGSYYEVTVEQVTVTGGTTTVEAGRTIQLTATVTGTPSFAVGSVTWSSSDVTKAAVNANGVVTGVAEGTATITATSTDDTSKIGAVEVTVTAPANPVQLTVESATVYLKSPVQLQAKVYLPGVSLIWESSNPSIATVSENGLVTGKTVGTTVVTVKSKANPEYSDTATITVQKEAEDAISGTDGNISISPSGEITLLPGGDTVQLTVEGIGENETVTWTSGDRRFAAVQDGLVTSVGVGSTTITAVVGGKTLKARVNVVADNNMITNDTFYVDTDGNPILSQGGGIFKFGSTYYWYGVKYEQAENYSKNPIVSEASRSNSTTFSAVTCYTSTDLINWTYEGDVVTKETFKTAEYPDAYVSWFGRMGVMYNVKNNNYTLVSQGYIYSNPNADDPNRINLTNAVVFLSCDSPTGNFGNVVYQKAHEGGLSGIPSSGSTGDQTVFIDDDGTPYLIASQAGGRARQFVCEFDDDYMWIEKVHEVYRGEGREGNCMFKYNGYYYIASSDLHGWNASPAYVLKSKTKNILGEYEMMAAPMTGSVEGYSHVSQTGFFYTVKNGSKETVLFCGDRWSGFGGNGMGFHSWVPLSFELNADGSAKEIIFNDLSQFYFNESTGDWSVGPFNNYVVNPAFEADRITVSNPMGWVVSGGTNVEKSSPFSGRWSWQVTDGGSIKQVITSIPEGNYTLKLWTKGSGTGYVYINNSDGTELARFALDGSYSTWTQVMVGTGLEITGTCEIGVISTSGNVNVDDFTLIKTDGPKLTSYSVTTLVSENGTVRTDRNTAVEGDTVTVTTTPNEGYDVDSVMVSGGVSVIENADGTYSFVMPSANVTVTVTFKPVKEDTPSPGNPTEPGTPSIPSSSVPSVTTNTTNQGGTPATETTARPAATIKSGTATTAVSTSMGNEIVKQAVKNESTNVVIAPEVKGNVSKAEVTIPSAIVEQIGSKTSADLTVSTPVAEVNIPNGALSKLAESGKNVTVTAERSGNTMEVAVNADNNTMQNVPGGLKVTVPVEEIMPGTVAVLVKENGTRQVIRKSVAGESSVIVPLGGSARIEIVDNGKQFSDVPAGDWAADAVAFVSAHELFSGTSDTTFSPNTPMSRGMLAVVLHNLENNPSQTFTGAFYDVDNTKWYAEGIAWAAEMGIVTGYSNGQFGPDDDITREQLAVMFWRYAGKPAATGSSLNFNDADKTSDWAKEAMLWASEKGIINGKGNGILDPAGKATHAQTAQMLKNFMENQ